MAERGRGGTDQVAHQVACHPAHCGDAHSRPPSSLPLHPTRTSTHANHPCQADALLAVTPEALVSLAGDSLGRAAYLLVRLAFTMCLVAGLPLLMAPFRQVLVAVPTARGLLMHRPWRAQCRGPSPQCQGRVTPHSPHKCCTGRWMNWE